MSDIPLLDMFPQILAGGGVAGGFIWIRHILKRAEQRANEEPFAEPEVVVNELWQKEWAYWNHWLIAVCDQKAPGKPEDLLKRLLQFMYATKQPLQEGYEQPEGVSGGMYLSHVFVPYRQEGDNRWVLAGSDSEHPTVRNLAAVRASIISLPAAGVDFRRQAGTLTRQYADHFLSLYRPSPSTIRVLSTEEWEAAISRQRMLNFEAKSLLERIENWLTDHPQHERTQPYEGDVVEALNQIAKARDSRVEPAALSNADLMQVSGKVTVPSSLTNVLTAEEEAVMFRVQREFQGMSKSEQHDSESLVTRLMEAVKAARSTDEFDQERRGLAERLAAENRRLAVAGLVNLLDRVRVSQQEARLRTLRTENLYLTETVNGKPSVTETL